MDTLGKLFGGREIIKILRLFLLNTNQPYELTDIVSRTKVDPSIARREIAMLKSISFIKSKQFYKDAPTSSSTTKTRRKRVSGYVLNMDFPYLDGLKSLLAGSDILDRDQLLYKLRKTGSLKLVVLAGIFVQDFDGRLDILIAGDRLRPRVIERIVGNLESELGREIRYAAFSTSDFLYRLSMRDRLIRDTLDYSHDTVIDRLGVEKSDN